MGSERDEADTDHDNCFERQQQHNHNNEKRFVNVPRLMKNGNDIISVESIDDDED